jgi:hypothetical protein
VLLKGGIRVRQEWSQTVTEKPTHKQQEKIAIRTSKIRLMSLPMARLLAPLMGQPMAKLIRHPMQREVKGREVKINPTPTPPEGVGSDPTAAEVQEKRQRAAETLKNHPVVAAVRSVRRKTPDPQHWERMIAAVEKAGPLDVPFMGKCWQEWYDRGYNRDSWKWLTDWYCHKVIPEPGERYDPDTVGQYQPPPEEPPSPDGPKRLSGADLGALAETVRVMVREQGRPFQEVVEQLGLETLNQKDYTVVAKPVCPRCGGAGLESVPGKGARPCDHRTSAELPRALNATDATEGGENGGERGDGENDGSGGDGGGEGAD